jgi:hypothetical protein
MVFTSKLPLTLTVSGLLFSEASQQDNLQHNLNQQEQEVNQIQQEFQQQHIQEEQNTQIEPQQFGTNKFPSPLKLFPSEFASSQLHPDSHQQHHSHSTLLHPNAFQTNAFQQSAFQQHPSHQTTFLQKTFLQKNQKYGNSYNSMSNSNNVNESNSNNVNGNGDSNSQAGHKNSHITNSQQKNNSHTPESKRDTELDRQGFVEDVDDDGNKKPSQQTGAKQFQLRSGTEKELFRPAGNSNAESEGILILNISESFKRALKV